MVRKKQLGPERPKDWCYLRKGKYGNLWIIELPAALRTIMYCDGYVNDGDELQHLRISMPRTLWLFSVVNERISHTKVVAVRSPFSETKLLTIAYCTALPNTDVDGHLCTGDDFQYSVEKESEVQMLDRFMKYLLYESIWNEELDHHSYVLNELGLDSMEEWAAESRGKDGAKFGDKMFPRTQRLGTVGELARVMFNCMEGGD